MKRSISPDPPEVLSRVLDGLDLVDAIAANVRVRVAPHLLHDELVSFGREALLAAARRFDPAYDVPFRAWARRRVRGAMIDAIRSRCTGARRQPLQSVDVADLAIGDIDDLAIADNDCEVAISEVATESSPEDRLYDAQLMGAMRTSVARLPEPERHMLERMYFDDAPMALVGAELGVSPSWASRIHARGVARVTRDMRRRRFVA